MSRWDIEGGRGNLVGNIKVHRPRLQLGRRKHCVHNSIHWSWFSAVVRRVSKRASRPASGKGGYRSIEKVCLGLVHRFPLFWRKPLMSGSACSTRSAWLRFSWLTRYEPFCKVGEGKPGRDWRHSNERCWSHLRQIDGWKRIDGLAGGCPFIRNSYGLRVDGLLAGRPARIRRIAIEFPRKLSCDVCGIVDSSTCHVRPMCRPCA